MARANYLFETANVEAKDRDKIDKPDPWPRPYEVARPPDDDDEPGR